MRIGFITVRCNDPDCVPIEPRINGLTYPRKYPRSVSLKYFNYTQFENNIWYMEKYAL